MSKRFSCTEIWDEDWFIDLPKDYKLFWAFLKDTCDHAGIWKPNISRFNKLYDCSIDLKEAVELLNKDKQRVIVLLNGRWFICGFITFQYGKSLNLNNNCHKSVLAVLKANNVLVEMPSLLLDIRDAKEEQVEATPKEAKPKEDLSEKYQYLKDDKFASAFKDYLEMRSKIKKTATLKAKEMALNALHAHEIDVAIKMVNQSTMNSWAGIFPIKMANGKPVEAQPKMLRPADKDCKHCGGSGQIFAQGSSKNIACWCRTKEMAVR